MVSSLPRRGHVDPEVNEPKREKSKRNKFSNFRQAFKSDARNDNAKSNGFEKERKKYLSNPFDRQHDPSSVEQGDERQPKTDWKKNIMRFATGRRQNKPGKALVRSNTSGSPAELNDPYAQFRKRGSFGILDAEDWSDDDVFLFPGRSSGDRPVAPGTHADGHGSKTGTPRCVLYVGSRALNWEG